MLLLIDVSSSLCLLFKIVKICNWQQRNSQLIYAVSLELKDIGWGCIESTTLILQLQKSHPIPCGYPWWYTSHLGALQRLRVQLPTVQQ